MLEHGAVRAWGQLGPERTEPESLGVSKQRRTSAARCFEDGRIRETLSKIVNRLNSDPAVQEDLMQEGLIRLWKVELEQPGRTRSWYLQNCKFHLQHWLKAGRSLDSRKRVNADNRVTLDGVNDDTLCPTEDQVFEAVSARDIVSTLAHHLAPCERPVVGALADGLHGHEIAVRLNLSYPTVLKYRRKIASLTVKLGISTPTRATPVSRCNFTGPNCPFRSTPGQDDVSSTLRKQPGN